ncbi:MAG: mandelate racemase/muconate lactonizing enzyme family protein [Actinomycetota bacterium]
MSTRIAGVDVLEIPNESTGFHTFVRISTECGTTGLGQSGGWGYQRAVGEIIKEMTPLLLGQDPFRIEHLWHLLYRSRPFRGNLISSAVAAIDNALWDIKGKKLGVPVWQLIGGNYRDKVRLHVLIDGNTPDEIAASVKQAIVDGYTAVKFDPLVAGFADLSMPALVESALEMGHAARAAGGNDLDIIFELHRKLDPFKGVVVANALAQFRPLFIEDPIQIDSIEAQATICKRINSPVATGERLNNIWEYRELLSYGVPIHVRPDLGMSGGISMCLKIAAIAESHHASVVPHNFLGPGITAPTLHLSIAIPNLLTMEYYAKDEDPKSSCALVKSSAKRLGGYMEAPDTPGLGIELDTQSDASNRGIQIPMSSAGMLRTDGSVMRSV